MYYNKSIFMKNEQINTRGLGNLITSIGGATLGGLITGKKQKEEEKAIAQKQAQVRETLGTLKEISGLNRESLLEAQKQRQARNLTVQLSSGFETSSFDILNASGLEKDKTDIKLFDLQTKLQEQEVMAGMPSQKSEWAKASEMISGLIGTAKFFA